MIIKTIIAERVNGENGCTVLCGHKTSCIDFLDINNKKYRYIVKNVFNDADARAYIQFLFCGHAIFSNGVTFFKWDI